MVASSSGVAYFCTELSDSPSLLAQADRRSVQSLEHRFLARRLLLRFRQHVPGVAVHRLQANHVLAAQPGNRAGQHGLAAGALADLAGHLRRQTVTGGTAHQLQGLVHLALGNQVEKGRLLKLYRESLLQRVVEDRVAGRVVEVGEHDGVFVGELAERSAREAASDQGDGDNDDRRNRQHVPARKHTRFGAIELVGRPRRHGFQIVAHFRSGRVALLAVFLDCLSDDIGIGCGL